MMMMDDSKIRDAESEPITNYKNHVCSCVCNSLEWAYFEVGLV